MNGHQYILTIIDKLSSYAVARPILAKTSESVAITFINIVVCIFGTPSTLLSDSGSEFCNSLLTTVAEILDSKHKFSSPICPQGNSRIANVHLFFKMSKEAC